MIFKNSNQKQQNSKQFTHKLLDQDLHDSNIIDENDIKQRISTAKREKYILNVNIPQYRLRTSQNERDSSTMRLRQMIAVKQLSLSSQNE